MRWYAGPDFRTIGVSSRYNLKKGKLMQVGAYMTRQPITVPADATMKEAVMLMRQHQIRHLPVVNGGSLIGILSDRDVRRASPSLLTGIDRENYDQVLNETLVTRIMTREPFTVESKTSLLEAVRVLVDKRIGSIPVVDGTELVGIFTERDALRVLLELIPSSEPSVSPTS